MASNARDGLRQLQVAVNNKPLTRRTTCDICRERKVRCDRNKPECFRCRRSGYKCAYPSENATPAKFTKALAELNDRLRPAESMIQASSQVKEHDPHRESHSHIYLPQSSTDFIASIPGTISESNFSVNAYKHIDRENLASDFDTVFDQLDGEPQWPETNQNEITLNMDLGENDQANRSWGDGFGFSNRSANLSSRSSPYDNDSIQLHEKADEDLLKKYFAIIQRHLPLVDEDRFRQSTVNSNASQARALKYAIFMAAAHIDKESSRERQFYKTARYHIEQAELETHSSVFWSLEVAQALVLVARYEVTHMNLPQALITISRLDTLLSILQRRLDEKNQSHTLSNIPKIDSNRKGEFQRTIFFVLSLKYRNVMAAQIHDDAESYLACMQPSKLSAAYNISGRCSIFDRITSSTVNTLDDFSLFMLSCRIASDADLHRRETAVDATGPLVKYNYCHIHDRIDQEIGIMVSRLASTHLSTQPIDNELSVLAMIMILGARIQLFNTAILHSGMAGFLKPVVDECLRQNVSTAKDISDIILQAQVLDNARITIYREAGFYIMPSLALAAEAHMRLAEVCANKITGAAGGNSQHFLSSESRESLNVLYRAMEACKDETDRYADLLSQCQGFIGSSGSWRRLRTEFTNLDRLTTSISK